ncbi:MAG: AGE family epimerase/isomerase [Pseudomonadota bacterium]|nr:AGE family epimerase/isomerase [Pseudomonadota bacterium]
MTTDTMTPRAKLEAARQRLTTWLRDAAYPLWAAHGIDPRNGGFIETLAQDGTGLPHPRRARVHPRQIYAFAQAPGFGWNGARGIVERGMDYFTAHYLRPDGLFRTLAGVDGAPMDERAVLYDQAFALLGYAAAAVLLDDRGRFEQRALALRQAIESRLGTNTGAFHSDESAHGVFESNPHMHLLEACLAWAQVGSDAGWTDWARHIVELAMRRFIRADTGALGECFSADWQPAPGIAGRIIEPGHQFEWAWLLLRCESRHPGSPVREAALRLIGIGERCGVHQGVAINALLDDFSIHDPNARFWPQTERLKAALLAAQLTGEEQYWSMAAAATDSLFPYLDTPVAGLWLDVQLPNGKLVDAPAPASTFYHLVGAIVALDTTLDASPG